MATANNTPEGSGLLDTSTVSSEGGTQADVSGIKSGPAVAGQVYHTETLADGSVLDFATPEELSAWYDTQKGKPAEAGEEADTTTEDTNLEGSTEEAAEEETAQDTLVTTEEAADTLLPFKDLDDTALRAKLTEQGGFWADPKVEAAVFQFERTGEVTAEVVASTAEALGLPPEAVTEYIAGQKALRAQASQASTEATAAFNQQVSEIKAVVGTPEAYTEVMTWAKDNLPQADKDAYHEALEKSPAAAKVILKNIHQQFKEAGNQSPRNITKNSQGTSQRNTGPIPYASTEAWHSDMANEKYNLDTAEGAQFRAKVQARLRVSKL